MAMTVDDLKALMDEIGISYFKIEDRPVLTFRFGGVFGKYHAATELQVDGTFVLFRVFGYLECPAGHRSLDEVLKVVAHLNYDGRFVKFGWDPSDGEITATAEIWVMDNPLTEVQFSRMMMNYLTLVDYSYGRLSTTIETGRDPGDPDEATVNAARQQRGGGGAPSGGDQGEKVTTL